VKDGYIDLPTAPGLGIELDEAALRDHALGERRSRRIRQFTDEVG
jgi:L-alanine-DL-glutamate epimerase-like enolase superfamily enzyme